MEELQRYFGDIRAQVENYRRICLQVLEAREDGEQLNLSLKGYRFFAKEESHGKSNYQLFLEDIVEFLENQLQIMEEQLKVKTDLQKLMSVF